MHKYTKEKSSYEKTLRVEQMTYFFLFLDLKDKTATLLPVIWHLDLFPATEKIPSPKKTVSEWKSIVLLQLRDKLFRQPFKTFRWLFGLSLCGL